MSTLFTDILRQARRGRAVEELTHTVADVVKAVDDTGKPGTITLVMKISPANHGGPEKTVQFDIKSKKPIADIAPSIFFSDEEGSLLQRDPNQEEMRFSDAKAGADAAAS